MWLTAGLRDLPEHDRFQVSAGLLAECLAKLATAAAAGAEALPEDHREHAALVALSDDAAVAAELLGDVPDGGGPDTVAWAELESAARSGPGAPRWTLTRSPVTPARRHPRDPLGAAAQRRAHQRHAHASPARSRTSAT